MAVKRKKRHGSDGADAVTQSSTSSAQSPKHRRSNSHSQHLGSPAMSSSAFMTFAAAPEWQKDNEFIKSGYRPEGWGTAVSSIWQLHNETVNIWTHLLGGLCAFVLLVFTLSTLSPHGHERFQYETVREWEATCPAQSLLARTWLNMTRDRYTPNPYVKRVHPKYVHLTGVRQVAHSVAARARELRTQMEESGHKLGDAITSSAEFLEHQLVSLAEAAHLTGHHSPVHNASVTLADRLDEFVHLQPVAELLDMLDRLRRKVESVDLLQHLHVRHSVHDYLEMWPLAVFLASAVVCMLMSATFHLFAAVSPAVAATFQRLDYAGICLLIFGSTVPVVQYGFYCEDQLRNVYMGFIVLVNTLGFVMSLMERFSHTKWRPLRAGLFSVMGCSGVVPLIHICNHHQEVVPIVSYLLVVGGLYGSGALLYAARIPERCHPGAYDVCGHSHQIFHVSVFLAVVTNYVGLLAFFEWRITIPCS